MRKGLNYGLVTLLLVATACSSKTANPLSPQEGDGADLSRKQESSIAFSKLARGSLYTGGSSAPSLVVAATLEEGAALALKLSDRELSRRIHTVDYGQNWLVAVFRGESPSTGYGIDVNKVLAAANDVRLTVELIDPKPETTGGAEMAYPYEVVVIPKDQVPGGAAGLWSAFTPDGKEVARTSYNPPSEDPLWPERIVDFNRLGRGTIYAGGPVSPTLFVISTPAEAASLAEKLSDDRLTSLVEAMDFRQSRLVAVFRGEMRTAGYGIEIDGVKQYPDGVRLTVSLKDPPPDQATGQVITYPFDAIAIDRDQIEPALASSWAAYTSDGDFLAMVRFVLRDEVPKPVDGSNHVDSGTAGPGDSGGSSGAGGQGSATTGSDPTTVTVTDVPTSDGKDGGGVVPIGTVSDDVGPGTTTPGGTSDDDAPSATPGSDPKPGKPVAPTADGPDIRGTVTEVLRAGEKARADGILLQIRVEGVLEPDTNQDKALVTVLRDTRISLRVAEDRLQASSAAALTQGVRVEVRFNGPVMESYPVQARAGEIVIIKEN